MEWMVNNWYMIVIAAACVLMVAALVIGFFDLDRDAQIEKVKEWLKYAVLQAEKELKSGTGAAKLSMVYDMFVSRFGWLARVITFAQFSKLVDEALVWLRVQLEHNDNIKEIINEGK